MMSYGAGLVASAIKLVLCVSAGSALQARVTALRAGFLIIHVSTHGLMWAASTAADLRLVALQQRRNTVLAAGVSLALCMFAAAALCQGAWGAAGFAALRGDKPTVYWVFMVYRHLVQPTRLHIGLLPSLLLAAEFWLLTSCFSGHSWHGWGQTRQRCCWCLHSSPLQLGLSSVCAEASCAACDGMKLAVAFMPSTDSTV
jgi:hypothetical protein